MTENRFFTLIWRYNGLMIAVAATLFVGILTWELTRDWRRSLFPTQATEVLNVAPAPSDQPSEREIAENARFGAPTDSASRGIYALPLYVDQTYSNRGISKETGGNRTNFLIVDTADQSQRWLFDASARLITEVRPLWHTPKEGARRFLGHILFVIEDDTNNGARLSRSDLGRLLHVTPDWKILTPLAEDIAFVLEARTTGPDSADIILRVPEGSRLIQIALPRAEVTATIDLIERP